LLLLNKLSFIHLLTWRCDYLRGIR